MHFRKLCAAALLAFLAAPTARAADFGTMTLQLKKKVGTSYQNFNSMELLEFFNQADCLCHAPFAVEMTLSGAPTGDLGTSSVEIWLGSQCGEFSTQRDARCAKIASETRPIEAFHNRIVDIELDAAKLMFPNGSCGEQQGENTVWALVDEGLNQSYEHIWQLSPVVAYDTQPPTAPTAVTTVGVEDGVKVSWTLPTVGIEGVRSYQVLCASSTDSTTLFASPPADPDYRRTQDVEGCTNPDTVVTADAGVGGGSDAGGLADAGADNDAPVVVGDAGLRRPADDSGLPDARVADAAAATADAGGSAAFNLLDKAFVCSAPVSRTSTSIRIDLSKARALAANEYVIAKLVVTDNARNFTVVDVAGMVRPQPARNAWQVYGDDNGKAKGGYCAVAPGSRAGGGAAKFIIGLGILAWSWRRRRAALVLIVVLCAARPAAAQVFLDDIDATAQAAPGLPDSDWAFELKIGPYRPDIDGESGLTGKPYQETFGDGSSIMPQMELDYFFLHPFGELGIGGSAGYMSNSAKSFTVDPNTGMRGSERSADDTGFTLYPLSLAVVYRMTELSDRTVVPLVPYAKLGLSYYLWRITKGDGSLASTPTGGDASGATLGWQGTLGLAVRADRFDAEAARDLEDDLGVEHAGFFIEMTYAGVSGLGAANKLHVGDFTWAAGVLFEF